MTPESNPVKVAAIKYTWLLKESTSVDFNLRVNAAVENITEKPA